MKVCQIMALDEELASLEDLQILHGAPAHMRCSRA
jgi:hypothetical protein